jgi:hypothetical protein
VEEQVLLEVRFRQLAVQLVQLYLERQVGLVSMEILMQQELQVYQFQLGSHQRELEQVLVHLAVLQELKKEMVLVSVFRHQQPHQLQDVL